MRHLKRGRKLGRTAPHRKAMFRNMACSLIRSVRVDEDDKAAPKTPGRIVTTLAKAKELRPFVEKLVTMARKAVPHHRQARQHAIDAKRDSDEWRQWRQSDEWQKWNQAIAPAVALRRRAFALLRDNEALDVLFDELAERFEDRDGGYTRVVRLANVRLGDGGPQALIEFVGERDRVRQPKRKAPLVTDEEEESPAAAAGAAAAPAAEAPADERAEPEQARADETAGEKQPKE